jgi:hypothetical protein
MLTDQFPGSNRSPQGERIPALTPALENVVFADEEVRKRKGLQFHYIKLKRVNPPTLQKYIRLDCNKLSPIV